MGMAYFRCVAIVILATACSVRAAELRIDCSRAIGPIRPLHGGNGGPIEYGELVDLSDRFKELAVPHARLHDCHWPNPDVVDIHTIFPDFGADPARPESYTFSRTDDYLQAIVNVRSRIVYRLGESIEHTKKKYHVHPPADPEKWAAICLGIIRHYNQGWAGGFRHDIQYWEIWNEPENSPLMWTGSEEDYFRLYEVSAKAIKKAFPDLKVGGPSLGYTGRIVDGRFEPGEYMVKFLDRCRDRKLPLDFFSWHLYTNDPSECLVRAAGIRKELNRRGFDRTELHFNEWNYLPDNDWTPTSLKGQGVMRERYFARMAGAEGAAFAAAVLINLQDSAVDVANYYAMSTHGFGMFNEYGVPRKPFHALKAFRMLLDTPVRVHAAGADQKSLAIGAGLNEQKSELGILVSNCRADENIDIAVGALPWTGPSTCDLHIVNQAKDLEAAQSIRLSPDRPRITFKLPAPAVCFIRVRRVAD